MAELGGMNEEETAVLMLIHKGRTDITIQQDLSLSRKSYERVEESVRAKLLLAVFECINSKMNGWNK